MHIRNFTGVLAMAALVAAPAAHAQDIYTLDPAHTSVGFKVRHMMVTNVKGSFGTVSGTIKLAPNVENSTVEVSIEAASIDTNNEKRDAHLKSADFLDVETHPMLTFKSKKITKKGEQWVALGDLTIRGVTKEVELPFTLSGPATNPWGQQVIGIDAAFQINRTDYGANWNKALEAGGVLVDETVYIEIGAEAQKQSS
ncbi:MAG: YceI family protein [Candidatus Krumholzibacteria bacterium]|nr:YceI family protein [Candidatus Krumholzibacteria bacterium]MDH4337044.1 YceI family protein [Candidatus Krumholzibacteria bacterium]MDH5268581.1 YceI family protein [Candidatus Krumholzibacteria bacterium]